MKMLCFIQVFDSWLIGSSKATLWNEKPFSLGDEKGKKKTTLCSQPTNDRCVFSFILKRRNTFSYSCGLHWVAARKYVESFPQTRRSVTEHSSSASARCFMTVLFLTMFPTPTGIIFNPVSLEKRLVWNVLATEPSNSLQVMFFSSMYNVARHKSVNLAGLSLHTAHTLDLSNGKLVNLMVNDLWDLAALVCICS